MRRQAIKDYTKSRGKYRAMHYCVVINPSIELGDGIRHIIRTETDNEDDIKRMYYNDYNEIAGDKFVFFKTLKEAQEFANNQSK